MKINMFSLWQSFMTAVNTAQGGFYRPQTDFQQKVNDISRELWVEWTNEAEKSQEARDNLIYFLQSQNIKVDRAQANYGLFSPPANYGRLASIRIIVTGDNKTVPSKDVNDGKCDGIESQEEINEKYYSEMSEVTVQMIDNMRWGSMLEHPKKGPSMKYPKATQIDKGFKVAPRDISVVRFDYYVEPEEAVFGYTLAAGDRQTGAGAQIIYNQAKSKDLPWPDTVRNEFIIRLGVSFGVFTRDQFLTQISTQQKMTA